MITTNITNPVKVEFTRFISYGTVKSAEGKQYRLAVFCEESPIIITCNHVDFQKEFEESKVFVRWLTEWIDW